MKDFFALFSICCIGQTTVLLFALTLRLLKLGKSSMLLAVVPGLVTDQQEKSVVRGIEFRPLMGNAVGSEQH